MDESGQELNGVEWSWGVEWRSVEK